MKPGSKDKKLEILITGEELKQRKNEKSKFLSWQVVYHRDGIVG
jgi:hypothetical protein